MKLSEKGIETIFSALLKTIEERDLVFRRISQGVFKKHIEALEFKPDDFHGVVTLTVEEAKKLARLVNFGADWSTNLPDDDLIAEDFKRRIEQAEIFQIGEDYNKALNKALAELTNNAEGKCSSE